MLADFHPKGAMAKSMGVYLEEHGVTDRATVIVDAAGVVRHASSTGKRDMEHVAQLCEEIDKSFAGDLPAPTAAEGLAKDAVVYLRGDSIASRPVLLARTNLHIGSLAIKDVGESSHLADLKSLTGADTTPVLVESGAPVAQSAKIVGYLAAKCATP